MTPWPSAFIAGARERWHASLAVVAQRPRHVALAGASVGLACSPLSREAVLLAAAGLAAAGSTLSARASPGGGGGAAPVARTAVLAALALIAGAGFGALRLTAVERHGNDLSSGDSIQGSGHLLGPPRPGPFGSSAEVRMTSGSSCGARLLVRLPREGPLPQSGGSGAEVLLSGSVRTDVSAVRASTSSSRGGSERPFDLKAYLRRQGLAAEVMATRASVTGRARGGVIGALDAIRRRAERGIARGLSPPRAALAQGMVLGQDERIARAVRDDFQASGLAHVLAVSGQNVMLLAALALPLLAGAGLPRAARIAATIALVVAYVPLAGAGPSLQRAGVMGVASLVALAASRPASRWYALLLAACVTLALNPLAITDPGWQLSFAAVAGILVLVGPLRGALKTLPRLLADGVAVTVAATVATAPLLAFHFGTVSAASLPANVLALPLVAPIMWLGMLRAGLAQLGDMGEPVAWATGLAIDGLGLALSPLVGALSLLAGAFAELPGAELGVPLASNLAVGLAYGALALLALAGRRLARRSEATRAVGAAWWRRSPRAWQMAALAAGAALVITPAALLLRTPGSPSELTVSFLDVGQGDATLIQHPDGTAVLFDGGPPEGRVVRLLRRAGVRRLSAVVMTHASRDHHGGLPEVVDRYPVDLLLDGGDGTADRDFRAVVAAARDRGARHVKLTAPMALRIGGVGMRILSPAPRGPGPAPEDPNPRAVIAVVSAGDFDLLLSADAESPSLLGLALPDVDAMKVPHHGSADPGLGEVLERLRPEVAAIEVGENTYGHPAPPTLAALRRAEVPTYRTDEHGTVKVTVDHGRLQADPERGDPLEDRRPPGVE